MLICRIMQVRREHIRTVRELHRLIFFSEFIVTLKLVSLYRFQVIHCNFLFEKTLT